MIVLSKLNNIILNWLEKEVLSNFFSLLLPNEEELKYDRRALAIVMLSLHFLSSNISHIHTKTKMIWSYFWKFLIYEASIQNNIDIYQVLEYIKKKYSIYVESTLIF